MSILKAILCPVCVLLLTDILIRSMQAGHFTCIRGPLRKINIDPTRHQEDHIIPVVENISGFNDNPAHGDTICNWTLHNSDKTAPGQMVLEGVTSPVPTNPHVMLSFQLQQSFYENASSCSTVVTSANAEIDVALGMFHVIALPPGGSLRIRLRQHSPSTDKAPFSSKGAIALQVVLADVGFCARHMLSYQGKCHAITHGHQSLSNQLMTLVRSSSGGAARMATFASFDDIHDFIKANNKPVRVFSMQSLNLTQPVRIGLFYNNATRKVAFLNASAGRCVLQEMQDSAEIESAAGIIKGSCGTLSVNQSGSPILQFVNCLDPMPALISFRERPVENDCSNCTLSTIEEWLKPADIIVVPSWYLATEMVVAYINISGTIFAILLHGIRHLKKKLDRTHGSVSLEEHAAGSE